MIRNTLKSVRDATFCIELPNQAQHGMPMPAGTGFFVSPDGWFVTAAHVLKKSEPDNYEQRDDIDKAWLTKESSGLGSSMCQFITLGHVLLQYDFALLKVNFEKNSNKEWLKGRDEFPYINISSRKLEMGESVYSFGYPLSTGQAQKIKGGIIGSTQLSPRLTSAVVSSDLDKTQMIMTDSDPKHYVLDKALNYGNSGGPIIASETGCVHAFCSRFQPVYIPQHHLKNQDGTIPYVMIPSLYGVVSSLNNEPILKLLRSLGVHISED